MNSRTHFSLIVLICTSVLLASCASGPRPPEKGTPAFYWQAANETFATGDYIKTSEHLSHILKTENEFTARALPWKLVLSAGMAKGYMDLADSYEYGARANRANPMPFRKQVNAYRNFASGIAMQFAEAFQQFHKGNKDETLALAFGFPTGSAAQVPQLTKVSNGIFLHAAELQEAERRTLERSVLLATCRALGYPDDTAKSQQVFKAGNVQAPRAPFIMAMASALYEQAQMFGRDKLDQPQRVQLFTSEALEGLKSVPESKETKELSSKLQKNLKIAKVS